MQTTSKTIYSFLWGYTQVVGRVIAPETLQTDPTTLNVFAFSVEWNEFGIKVTFYVKIIEIHFRLIGVLGCTGKCKQSM
jgi:hypothetical protein